MRLVWCLLTGGEVGVAVTIETLVEGPLRTVD